jgi:membrane-associated phospholipid phosphatase
MSASRSKAADAGPDEAANEVLSGEPGAGARRWLGPLTIVVGVLFAIDTYFVATRPLLPFDVPLAVFVQRFPWGPVIYPMELINWLGGYRQVGLGLIAILCLALWERRAGWLMALGGLSSIIDNLIKLSMERHRPTADLVHILTPASGYSYPSGHAVFFTWLSFMLAVSLAPRFPARLRFIPWTAAMLITVLTCLARVWAGDHWPSDVMGGMLLGIGWSAFVLWLPERLLPQPSFRWVRGRLRPVEVAEIGGR